MVKPLKIICESEDDDWGEPVLQRELMWAAPGEVGEEGGVRCEDAMRSESVWDENVEVMSRFDELLDDILVEILKKCDGKSIASVQCTSRRMLLLGSMPSVWEESLLKNHGLKVPKEIGTSWSTFRDISRELVDDEQMDSRLLFRGFLTDGGMVDGTACHWVDNMFHRDIHTHYCSSSMGPSGIRCIALLAPKYTKSLKLASKLLKPISAILPSEKNLAAVKRQEMLHVDSRLGIEAAATRTCALIRRIEISKNGGMFFRPVERGALLLGSKSSTAESGRGQKYAEDLARGLYSQTMSPMVNMVNSFVNLATILIAYKNGKIQKPERVGIEIGDEGAGEWVEFGSCPEGSGALRPVVWFRFYSSSERSNGWTREREIQAITMKSKFTTIGTDVLMVNAGGNCLKHSSGLLNIPLMYPSLGDVACTVLSSSEAVLPEVIEIPREKDYVEVNYVWMYGKEVQV